MHWISGAASGTLSGVPIDDAVLTAALAETGVDHGPGLFGLVTEHGEVVFEGSVGVADLARPRPIAAQDRFRIASVTKTYVAALVMQLIAEGRLSLDDSVQQRLPGLVPDSSEITVELLLRMRSGLPDWVGPVFGDPPDIRVLDRYWAPTELVEIALTADSRVAPGTGYRYCNTDYARLGLMIEKVTGRASKLNCGNGSSSRCTWMTRRSPLSSRKSAGRTPAVTCATVPVHGTTSAPRCPRPRGGRLGRSWPPPRTSPGSSTGCSTARSSTLTACG